MKNLSVRLILVISVFVLAGGGNVNGQEETQAIIKECQDALRLLKAMKAVEESLKSVHIAVENSLQMDSGLSALVWFSARRLERDEHEIISQMELHMERKFALEAEKHLKKATGLAGNNRSPYAWFMLGWVQYRYLDRFEEAVANIRVAVEIEEGDPFAEDKKEASVHTQVGLVWATIALERSKGNNFDQSREAIAKLRDKFDSFREGRRGAGQKAASVTLLELGYIIAAMYTQIEDKAVAMEVLNTINFRVDYTRQSDPQRFIDLTQAKFDSRFKYLHGDKTFEAFIVKIEKAILNGQKAEEKWDNESALERFKRSLKKGGSGDDSETPDEDGGKRRGKGGDDDNG